MNNFNKAQESYDNQIDDFRFPELDYDLFCGDCGLELTEENRGSDFTCKKCYYLYVLGEDEEQAIFDGLGDYLVKIGMITREAIRTFREKENCKVCGINPNGKGLCNSCEESEHK